jgi:pimeloyl-ACP methyl ester carboxylesterase
VPTLLVWGARDRMIPSWHAVTAQTAIEGSRVEVFERAGHFPHLDDPERFVRLLSEFIAEDIDEEIDDDEPDVPGLGEVVAQ